MKLMAPVKFAETCQNCGAPIDTDFDWLCSECLEEGEDPRNTTTQQQPHHIPCGQCGACAANEPCL